MNLLKFYHDLRLKHKLIFWFLIISFITALSVGIFSFNISSNSSIRNEIEKKSIVLDVIKENAYNIIHESELAAIRIACDDSIIDMLSNEDGKSDDSQIDFAMLKILYTMDTSVNLKFIDVFDNQGKIYTTLDNSTLIDNTEEQLSQIENEITSYSYGFWADPIRSSDGTFVLPYFRRIKSYKSNSVLGIVAIGLSEEDLFSSYTQYADDDMHIAILDRNGVTISSDNKDWIGNDFNEYFDTDKPIEENGGYFNGEVNGTGYLAVYDVDPLMGYTYVTITPVSVMMQTPNSIILMMVIIMIFAVLVDVIVSIFVSSNIAKPIAELANTMDEAENTEITHSFYPRYNDEIGRLARSFIGMTDRLNRSTERMLEAEEKRRLAEYNALKWQINPHFLYNTLSSIVWLAKKGYIDEIIEMTRALSTLFRIGINKDKELITIHDEMEHVKSYLEIQQLRYQDQFKYVIDVDADLMRLYTVKIILQPLVENAIYHGVREVNEAGLIRISGRIEDGKVVLRIMDNGDSMTHEEVETLNDFLRREDVSDSKFGIGVKNVHDRIRYYFKGDYGLTYKKEKGYIIAQITLPIVEVLPPDKHVIS